MLFLATVLKFALHRSTTSSLNCATLSHPVNLSTVDIRWQTVTERSETAELPQWTAYRKPSAIFRMVPSLTLLWPPFLFFFLVMSSFAKLLWPLLMYCFQWCYHRKLLQGHCTMSVVKILSLVAHKVLLATEHSLWQHLSSEPVCHLT